MNVFILSRCLANQSRFPRNMCITVLASASHCALWQSSSTLFSSPVFIPAKKFSNARSHPTFPIDIAYLDNPEPANMSVAVLRSKLNYTSVLRNIMPRTSTAILIKAPNAPMEELIEVTTILPPDDELTMAGLKIYSSGKSEKSLERLRNLVKFFRVDLQVGRENVRKLFVRFPPVLGLDVENKLRPKVLFYHDYLGIPMDRLAKMIVRQPNILGLHEDNIIATVNFFTEEVDIPKSMLHRVFYRQPSLLPSSIEKKFRPSVQLLRMPLEEGGLGLDRAQAATLVGKEPCVLVMNYPRLTEKFSMLRSLTNCTHKELQEAILARPNLLLVSMQESIIPRLETMKYNDVLPDEPFKVFKVFSYSKANFETWLRVQKRKALMKKSVMK